MSNEAPFDRLSKESLEAIERVTKPKVIPMCFPDWPCGRLKCKRCRRYHEENVVDENAIWGTE